MEANLEIVPKFGTQIQAQNAPSCHTLGEFETTSHPSLVLESFLKHFQLHVGANSVDKPIQKATLCKDQFLNCFFISEQMKQRLVQNLECIKTLGGLFKNRLYEG